MYSLMMIFQLLSDYIVALIFLICVLFVFLDVELWLDSLKDYFFQVSIQVLTIWYVLFSLEFAEHNL